MEGSFLPGFGIPTTGSVSNCQECGRECASSDTCRAYECLQGAAEPCKLHEVRVPTSDAESDYLTCASVDPKAPEVGVTLVGGTAVGSCEEFNDKVLLYLHRQTPGCPPTQAIQRFVFRHCGGINFQAHTECRGHASLLSDESTSHQTACKEGAWSRIEYLDKHLVMCPANQALSKWAMGGCHPDKTKIEFECIPALYGLGPVTHHDPPCHESVGKFLQYLDKQNPACPADKVMVGWHFVAAGCPGGYHRWRVYCASVLPG